VSGASPALARTLATIRDCSESKFKNRTRHCLNYEIRTRTGPCVGVGGEETYAQLLKLFPETWVLDPRPLPPQGAIAGLFVGGRPLQSWAQLYPLSKSERQFIVKPSGFSELAWGSRGVYVANDLTRDEWMAVLDGGLAVFEKNPQIRQRDFKGRRVHTEYLDKASGAVRTMDGRVRLCPFYFVAGDEAKLSGVLATIVPAEKRIIHGMPDAIMTVCMESEDGY